MPSPPTLIEGAVWMVLEKMQECNNTIMQECNNARMQEYKYAGIQECKNARMAKITKIARRIIEV